MFSFKKIINISLIVFFVAFSLLFCINKFANTPLISGNNNKLIVYEWWHIESFEGGGANRHNYLKQLALSYEKQNPTTLFMVNLVDADQLEDALSKHKPHLISFSEQVATIVLPHLIEFDNEYNIRDNYLQSATYNGKLMALPFIASGYCYFTKTNSTSDLKLYTANNNSHSATPLISNQTINSNQTLSSYECYTKFVNTQNGWRISVGTYFKTVYDAYVVPPKTGEHTALYATIFVLAVLPLAGFGVYQWKKRRTV